MEDARHGHFQEVWVYRLDRLGRDDIDPPVVWRELEASGVKVYSVTEGVGTPFEYTIRVAMNAEERRTFLARSSAGMNRAAREGRYTGGIRPLGYHVEGERHNARLAPSDAVIWSDWTEADLVRRIYRWLGVEGRSCRWIAEELNGLGVPTAYQRDGRGVRGKKTQGRWRSGRIRNLVLNAVYKGELQYGRRSGKPNREVISASIEPLVSRELWDAAQQTLTSNRIMPKNTRRCYLLRSVIVCGLCGLHFSGSTQRDKVWYRCDGYLIERGPEGSLRG